MTSFDTPRESPGANEITELFSMLPALFGFEPHESLIAITTYGPRNRVGFRLRIDLPDPHGMYDNDIYHAAAQVAGHVASQEPEGVILLIVSAHDEPADSFITAVMHEIHVADIPILEMARGDGQRCRSYLCDDEGCCPPEGTPYAHQCSEAVAQAVFAGQQILPDRAALVQSLSAPRDALRQQMQDAFAAASRNAGLAVACEAPGTLVERSLEHLEPIIEEHLGRSDGESISDAEVAEFSVWIASVAVRDVIWSWMNRQNADDWLIFLGDVSRRVVEPFEPAVLSLTAFAAWLSGDGVQALIAAERAEEADRNYSMAQLILRLIHAGVAPTNWEAFAPEPAQTVPAQQVPTQTVPTQEGN